ncbi:MAG: decaprenyl-phosphate phosphoribosyltransferase [Chloroflexi bacterium]|nr:decaprenyl-phosphate phosphoribosyltransferase [Chloroflexota bacterium]
MEHSDRASTFLVFASQFKAIVRATRPKQWTKNLLVFLAMFFTINEAWNPQVLSETADVMASSFLALVVFSALSGAIYILNDICDIEQDREHPQKRFRPIASGQLSIAVGWWVAISLAALALGGAFLVEPLFGLVSVAYVGTMVAYSFVLKNIILLDVFAISTGFVLRVVAGAAVLEVPVSPWLYICTGLGALFIALSNRRGELASAGDRATAQRGTLEQYTLGFLDQLIGVVATSVVLTYSLYTFTAPNLPENHSMMLTIPFVVYGLFRYLYLVHAKHLGESPEDIFIGDAPLITSIVLWLAASATVLVVFRG